MAQLSCSLNGTIKRATGCTGNKHFIILFGYLMLFAELKNILLDNSKEPSCSCSKVVASVLCNFVPHDSARKTTFPCL